MAKKSANTLRVSLEIPTSATSLSVTQKRIVHRLLEAGSYDELMETGLVTAWPAVNLESVRVEKPEEPAIVGTNKTVGKLFQRFGKIARELESLPNVNTVVDEGDVFQLEEEDRAGFVKELQHTSARLKEFSSELLKAQELTNDLDDLAVRMLQALGADTKPVARR